ncbi:HAD family hydrolase [Salinicoccus sp. HZC-1]|uniref:HAD family hydrolase n=1 Tax=Salinicoccus sp. HZC-1 TaxID=3385497 RepID=UPI00398AE37F
MKVALFDFDGTLYPHETFTILMERLKNHPKFKKNYRRFVRNFAPFYIGYKLKLVKKTKMQHKAMEYYIRSFKYNSKFEIEQFFNDVAKDMAGELRDSLVKKIRQLQKDHYYIMLISGAFVPLLEAVFKGFNIDCIVGSEVRYKDDRLDYKSQFERVHADRKIDIIRKHFKDRKIDWKSSEAYSDSYSDLKMLELVGRPVAVTPDPELLAVASRKNWTIHID